MSRSFAAVERRSAPQKALRAAPCSKGRLAEGARGRRGTAAAPSRRAQARGHAGRLDDRRRQIASRRPAPSRSWRRRVGRVIKALRTARTPPPRRRPRTRCGTPRRRFRYRWRAVGSGRRIRRVTQVRPRSRRYPFDRRPHHRIASSRGGLRKARVDTHRIGEYETDRADRRLIIARLAGRRDDGFEVAHADLRVGERASPARRRAAPRTTRDPLPHPSSFAATYRLAARAHWCRRARPAAASPEP